MHINGQPVTSSGVMIVGPGEQAALTLPFGRFDLEFRPATLPQGINLQATPSRIFFDSTDNPLGFATAIVAPLQNGAAVMLRVAVYALGTGTNTVRIVHYTTT